MQTRVEILGCIGVGRCGGTPAAGGGGGGLWVAPAAPWSGFQFPRGVGRSHLWFPHIKKNSMGCLLHMFMHVHAWLHVVGACCIHMLIHACLLQVCAAHTCSYMPACCGYVMATHVHTCLHVVVVCCLCICICAAGVHVLCMLFVWREVADCQKRPHRPLRRLS